MALNTASAINYNNERGYDQDAIKIIQWFVDATETGLWDNQSVKAVYDWQKARISASAADGKVGPGTLGALIADMESVALLNGSEILRQYPYKMASGSGAPGGIDPVADFSQWRSRPFEFRKFKKGGKDYWEASGAFKVQLKLKSSLSLEERVKYEYRQEIWGKAWMTHPTSGTRIDLASKFRIPLNESGSLVGLPANGYVEDGIVNKAGGAPERYGYRNGIPVKQPGCKDLWLPNGTGAKYVLEDTPGYAEEYNGVAWKVHMEFHFRGKVVELLYEGDDEDPSGINEIQMKSWDYTFDRQLDWSKATQVAAQ